jgi:15-cis-phytoene synthase
MKQLFDHTSLEISKLVTNAYSSSFSMGIFLLSPAIRPQIYTIYAFVRYADEIVDSFEGFKQRELLDRFIEDYYLALEEKISLNPVLNSFQEVVNTYKIQGLVEQFLVSMKMDLDKSVYKTKEEYEQYILGSAEVVGLMCLKVFAENDESNYAKLKPYAMKLGSAFQKINFLRDFKADYNDLGRSYFPEVSFDNFNEKDKCNIVAEIELEFKEALLGIKMLPKNSRFGVYVAYKYYTALLNKIKRKSYTEVLVSRVRVPGFYKIIVLFKSYLRFQFNLM